MRSLLPFLLVCLLSHPGLLADTPAANPEKVPESTMKLLFIQPLDTTKAAAATRGIPLSSASPAEVSGGKPYRLVVLATLLNKEDISQWLVVLKLSAEAQQASDAKGAPAVTMHTSTGRSFQFLSRGVTLEINTLGPITKNAAAKVKFKEARAQLNRGYLSLGLNRNAEFFDVFKKLQNTDKTFFYDVSTKTFPPERIAEGRRSAEQYGLSEDVERSFAGSVPALIEFFNVLRQTPGTQELLWEIVDKPSPWAMLKALTGVDIQFNFDQLPYERFPMERWRLPARGDVVSLPMHLRFMGKDALRMILFTAPADAPLMPCAGIVSAIAQNPEKQDKVLSLRVIAIAP